MVSRPATAEDRIAKIESRTAAGYGVAHSERKIVADADRDQFFSGLSKWTNASG